jgi:excisionase family DNA binding protein
MVKDPGNILTIGELADYLKLSRSTLYKLAQAGKVPGQKVGKHWRFHRETIDLWMKAGRALPEKAAKKSRK